MENIDWTSFMDKRQGQRPYLNNDDRYKPKNELETIHHILPQSVAGSNIEDNKRKLFETLHMAFHRVHGNMDIRGQIAQLMYINAPALCDSFKEKVAAIISDNHSEYYYKNGIYLKRS